MKNLKKKKDERVYDDMELVNENRQLTSRDIHGVYKVDADAIYNSHPLPLKYYDFMTQNRHIECHY